MLQFLRNHPSQSSETSPCNYRDSPVMRPCQSAMPRCLKDNDASQEGFFWRQHDGTGNSPNVRGGRWRRTFCGVGGRRDMGRGLRKNICFRFGNGFGLVVFNDCGEWDYIDSYIAPDGTRTEADWFETPLLLNWEPKHFARRGITTGYLNRPLPVDQLCRSALTPVPC